MIFTFNKKRIGAGVLLLLALLSFANFYFEWGVFKRFSKEFMIGSFVLMFLYLFTIGPTLEEILDYRERGKPEERIESGLRRSLFLLTLMVAMLFIFLFGPARRVMMGEQVQREDWIELIIIEAMIVVAGFVGWRQVKKLRHRRIDRK